MLASFAPEVAACAEGDPVAAGILRDAARHIVATATAVCPPAGADEEPQIAFTGGLLKLGEPLLVPLREELHRQLPYARTVEAAGDPLEGSLIIAAGLAQGELGLPRDERMLWIVTD